MELAVRKRVSQKPLLLKLVVAVMINAAMGVIYLWAPFLLPIETFLKISRAELSAVPAVALVCFTVGMMVHDYGIRHLGRLIVACASFVLTGGGHLAFAGLPGYWSLMLGYGVLFGFGAGLGYGLALALASDAPTKKRPLAIGLVMSAFALSGILLPFAIGSLISAWAPPTIFGTIGISILAIGCCAATLLRCDETSTTRQPVSAAKVTNIRFVESSFLKLGAVFFLICYVGLMIMSHVTGIVAASGISDAWVGAAPALFTAGYLVGSLAGGKIVEFLGGSRSLFLVSVLAGGGLALLDFSIAPLALLGAAAIGATFGSSASLMPTLIGERYGAEHIGAVYGKLMISYGLAGLLAPWVTGVLYVSMGTYQVAILLGIGMCVIAAGIGASLGTPN